MAALNFNLFDLLFAAILAAGLLIGRRHGLTQEFFRVVKWLVLVATCSLLYAPVGALIGAQGFFDPFSANLIAYLGLALTVFLVFSMVQAKLGKKLSGTDAFGRSEYYLGMGSGLLRYGCMLVVLLALLNARAYTPRELKQQERYTEQNWGSNIFPTLHGLQVAIFEGSFTGTFARNYCGFLLITPTNPEDPAPAPPRIAGK